MKRTSWLDMVAAADGGPQSLTPEVRQALARLDDALFAIWIGVNVLDRDG